MKLWLTSAANEDLAYWKANDPATLLRIEQMLRQLRNAEAIPAQLVTPLAIDYPSLLSVRISSEQRLVFERLGDDIIVHQCRYHY